MAQGEPDRQTPAHIVEAANKAMRDGHTHYIPPQGLKQLREAIAEAEGSDPANVVVTTGATFGLWLAIAAVVRPGDEVLIADPSFGQFPAIVAMHGAAAVRVPTGWPKTRSVVTPERMATALTPRTRAIIVNSPDNPGIRLHSRDELVAIARRRAARPRDHLR